MKRKHSPAHDFWHPRIEGQIRHTMGAHPEWFVDVPERQRADFVNSLAKRIVGEIVAGYGLAPMPDSHALMCTDPVARGDASKVSLHGRGVLSACATAKEPKP